jgi:hypothetical protein
MYQPESKLFTASWGGDAKLVKKLLMQGVDVNEASTMQNKTALFAAAVRGFTDIARLLLENGANVNFRAKNECIILNLVAYKDDKVMARILLDAGGDVNAVDSLGRPALFYAMFASTGMISLLLSKGANINCVLSDGISLIQYAIESSMKLFGRITREMICFMLDNRADVGIVDYTGKTVLHEVVRNQDWTYLCMLLDHMRVNSNPYVLRDIVGTAVHNPIGAMSEILFLHDVDRDMCMLSKQMAFLMGTHTNSKQSIINKLPMEVIPFIVNQGQLNQYEKNVRKVAMKILGWS